MKSFSKLKQTTHSRREWIANVFRAGVLMVMAAFGVGQIIKARRLANDPDCIRLNTCQDCVELGGCKLEKAELFRNGQKQV